MPSNNITAIDIGTHSIKIVQLQQNSGMIKMTHVGIEYYQNPIEEIFAEGKIINHEIVGNIIKEHIKNNKLKLKDVIIGISAQHATIRVIQVPPVESEPDLKGLIENHGQNHVNYPIEDGKVSYHKIEMIQAEEQQVLSVLFVCVKKEDINSILEVCKIAKIKPDIMDIDNLGVSNALENSILDDGITAIIDIGASASNITIFKNKKIDFFRNILIGGYSISSVIKSTLELESIEQAEQEKFSRGLVLEDDSSEEIDEIIRANVEEITTQIRRTFDYYKAQSRETEIHKIILSGGTSKMQNIDEFICNDLGIEVIIGNPLDNIEIAVEDPTLIDENKEALTTAIGYALREVVQDI
jgi:type IV pilus assembly protein PilM